MTLSGEWWGVSKLVNIHRPLPVAEINVAAAAAPRLCIWTCIISDANQEDGRSEEDAAARSPGRRSPGQPTSHFCTTDGSRMSQPDRYDRDPPSTRRSRTTQRHIFADRRRESGDRNRGRATKLVTRRRQQKFVSEVAPPSFPLYLSIYLDRRRTFTVGVSDGLRRNANFYSHAYIRHASDIIKDAV